MKGAEITAARRALGLLVGELAAILGVNSSTVYRWENGQDRNVTRIDPRQKALLLELMRIATYAPAEAAAHGKLIRDGLELSPLYALHVMLSIGFESKAPPARAS